MDDLMNPMVEHDDNDNAYFLSRDAIILSLPPFEEVCPTMEVCSGPSGWQNFTIVQHVSITATSRSRLTPRTLLAQSRALHCPPDCPGAPGGSGVLYTATCQGYTSGSRCLDASVAPTCAFGSGSRCHSCPEGALCPGGWRAWPQAGYWTWGEDAGVMVRCKAPAARRCPGMTASHNAFCGPLYDPATPACASCLPGYYHVDGLCSRCPEGYSITIHWQPIVGLAAVCLTLLLLGTFGLTTLFRKYHFPVSCSFGGRLSLELLLWLVNVAQLVAQVGRIQVPGMPAKLRAVFDALLLVQFDISGAVPLECSNVNPLLVPLLTIGIHLTLVFVLLGTWVCCPCLTHITDTVIAADTQNTREFPKSAAPQKKNKEQEMPLAVHQKQAGVPSRETTTTARGTLGWRRGCCRKPWRGRRGLRLHGILLTVAVLGFPLATQNAMSLLHCIPYQGSSSANSGPQSVWVDNPYVTCGTGLHGIAFPLAVLQLLLGSLGLIAYLAVGSRAQWASKTAEEQQQHDLFRDHPQLEAAPRNRTPPSKCMPFTTLSESIHGPLRTNPAWGPVFSYGQPWLRPVMLCFFVAIAVVAESTKQPSDMVLGRGLSASLLIVAAGGFALTTPDHRWSEWKALPRIFLYLAGASIAILQLALFLQDATTDTPRNQEWTTFSTVTLWATLMLLGAFPVLVCASFGCWLRYLMAPKEARFPCSLQCRRRSQHSVNSSNSPESAQRNTTGMDAVAEAATQLQSIRAWAFLLDCQEPSIVRQFEELEDVFFRDAQSEGSEKVASDEDASGPALDIDSKRREAPSGCDNGATAGNNMGHGDNVSTEPHDDLEMSTTCLTNGSLGEHPGGERSFPPKAVSNHRRRSTALWDRSRVNPLFGESPSLRADGTRGRRMSLLQAYSDSLGPQATPSMSGKNEDPVASSRAEWQVPTANPLHGLIRVVAAALESPQEDEEAWVASRLPWTSQETPTPTPGDFHRLAHPSTPGVPAQSHPVAAAPASTVVYMNPLHRMQRTDTTRNSDHPRPTNTRGRRRFHQRHGGTTSQGSATRQGANDVKRKEAHMKRELRRAQRKKKSRFLAQYIQAVLNQHL